MVQLEQVAEQQRTCGSLYPLQPSMHYQRNTIQYIYIAIENINENTQSYRISCLSQFTPTHDDLSRQSNIYTSLKSLNHVTRFALIHFVRTYTQEIAETHCRL